MKPVKGFTREELASLPTLCVGQCCSLKIEDTDRRVWLCRVAGGITIERYDAKKGRWYSAEGGCQS